MSLTVEGTPVIQPNQTVPRATAATNPNTTGHNQPYYKPIASKKDTTFNVKVVKAKMSELHNGKVEFEQLEQTHVSLGDRTANVNTVTCPSGEANTLLSLETAWRLTTAQAPKVLGTVHYFMK